MNHHSDWLATDRAGVDEMLAKVRDLAMAGRPFAVVTADPDQMRDLLAAVCADPDLVVWAIDTAGTTRHQVEPAVPPRSTVAGDRDPAFRAAVRAVGCYCGVADQARWRELLTRGVQAAHRAAILDVFAEHPRSLTTADLLFQVARRLGEHTSQQATAQVLGTLVGQGHVTRQPVAGDAVWRLVDTPIG